MTTNAAAQDILKRNAKRETRSDALDATNYVSPSRLKLWLKCPLAYRLRYIDGVVTPTSPSLLLGKVVHGGLEFYYRYRKRGVTLFPEVVAAHIRKTWSTAVDDECIAFKSREEEHQLQKQAVALVTAYLCQLPQNEPRPIAVEERLQAPLVDPASGEDLGIPLVGIVDLVLDGSGGPIICDFKTAARSSSQLDIIHELQLSCYSYLCRQVTGRTESGLQLRCLIKTKTPKIEVVKFRPRQQKHFDRLFCVIRAYLDATSSNKFHIRPGLECSYCDFQGRFCRC